jgi:hypothetical protein
MVVESFDIVKNDTEQELPPLLSVTSWIKTSSEHQLHNAEYIFHKTPSHILISPRVTIDLIWIGIKFMNLQIIL